MKGQMTCLPEECPWQRAGAHGPSWAGHLEPRSACKSHSVQVLSFLSHVSTWFFIFHNALILWPPYWSQIKQMFSISLLDKFRLTEAKTNPAIDVCWTSGQGSQCCGAYFPGMRGWAHSPGRVTSFRGAEYHMAGRGRAEGATGSESVFLNLVWI